MNYKHYVLATIFCYAHVMFLRAVAFIKQALANGILTVQELNQHVQKILQAKRWIKQDHPIRDLDQLQTKHTYELKRKLFQAAITIVENENQLVPLDTNVVDVVSIIQVGSTQLEPFTEKLSQHRKIKLHAISHNISQKIIDQICQNLTNENIIIISINGMTQSVQNNYGITTSTKQLINKFNASNKQVILVIFGNPYSIQWFKNTSTVIVAYENDSEA